MCVNIIFFFAASLCFSYGDETILLESFSSPVHQWKEINDPVMGGKSYGTFIIQEGVGMFDGKVVDVPFLKAPGFIKTESTIRKPFSDVSSCSHLQLNVRTNTSYKGYRVSFGTARGPGMYISGYKAPFDVPVGDDFISLNIPFTNFSDYWDDATGDIIKTCQENEKYCPDPKTLRNMETITIWAEGVDGVVHLQVKSIAASGCSNENESQDLIPTSRESVNLFSPSEESSINSNDGTVVLESFSSTVHQWRSENDPVMGGKSFGTFRIEKGLGVWDGEVVNVPSLKAPGFIQMRTYDRTKFSDVSSCSHLQLNIKTNTSYGGYKVSFGTSRGCPLQIFAFGYKAPFNIPVSDDFTSVNIPFTSFSDCWDDATGAIIKTCEEDKRYCPNSQTLENFGTMAIWGEGTDGVVHLQVKSIAAIGCQ